MKKVLLTGASGFIGRHAIAPLREHGFEVHAVSRGEGHGGAGVVWHRADLLDPAARARLLAEVRPSHLLHLAWYAAHGKYWTAAENLDWVEASLGLLREFQRHGGRRVVTAGTCAEYDWTAGGVFREGITPLLPASLYGTSKHALRLVTEAFALQTGLSQAWGRIFFVYGPYEHPDRLVASAMRSLLSGKPPACRSPSLERDYMYVGDAAAAFAHLLDGGVEGPVNIASGAPVSLGNLVRKIGNALGREELVNLGIDAPGNEPSALTASTVRLFSEAKWRPLLNLEQGLAKTALWWKENDPKN